MKYIILPLLCFLFLCSSGQENLLFKQIAIEHGLQSNTVYDIKVLKNHLLFIAHEKGLSSFDGTRFINYYNRDFPFCAVSNILQTDDGQVFCKSFNNVFFKLVDDSLHFEFELKNDQLYHYSFANANTITGLYHDSLYFYNTHLKKLQYKSIHKGVSASSLKQIEYTILNRSEMSTSLIAIDHSMNYFNVPMNLDGVNIIQQLKSKEAQLIVQNKLDLDLIESPSNKVIKKIKIGKNLFINNIVRIDQDLWICTTTGVYRLNKNSNETKWQTYLEDNNVSFVQKDGEGNYWFSTTNNGLFMATNFNIQKLVSHPSGFSFINGSRSDLFLGTNDGEIYTTNIINNNLKFLSRSQKQKSIESLFYDSVQKSIVYSSNVLYEQKNLGLKRSRIILKDYCSFRGTYLLAYAGFYLYSNKSNEIPWLVNRFENDSSELNEIKGLHRINYTSERLTSISADEENQIIYYATSTGIYQVDSTSFNPILLLEHRSDINDIVFYKNQIYVATKDKGLCVLKGMKLAPASIPNLSSTASIVYNLHVFNEKLWIHTENEIAKFDGQSSKIYSSSDGLPMQKVKDFYVDNDRVFLNVGHSILMFREGELQQEPHQAKLLIHNLVVNKKNYDYSKSIILNHEENNIIIHYSLIAFNNPTTTSIEYTINDGDPIRLWSEERNVSLPSLSSGTYEIKFFIVSNQNVESKESAIIRFEIKPPFWKTWWFILVSSVVLTGLMLFSFWRIWQKQKRENTLVQSKLLLEKELDKSMLSSIKAQMNPHFLFNALNTIQSYIYLNDKESAIMYTSKFSDLTRNILEMSTKDTITLDEEIKSLTLYLELEKMRFEDTFNYEVNIDRDLNRDYIKILSMLVQPYVENAIKYGLLHKKNNRVLKLTFKKENNLVVITIDDNGIGRKRSQELNKIKNRMHQSFAMEANKKRLEILKNNFEFIHFSVVDKYSNLGEPIGTQVIISLPV